MSNNISLCTPQESAGDIYLPLSRTYKSGLRTVPDVAYDFIRCYRSPLDYAFRCRSNILSKFRIITNYSTKPNSSSWVPLSTLNIRWSLWSLLRRRRAGEFDSHFRGPYATLGHLPGLRRRHWSTSWDRCWYGWASWPHTIISKYLRVFLLLLL